MGGALDRGQACMARRGGECVGLLSRLAVLDLITGIGGIRAMELLRCLDGPPEVAETELAQRLGMDVHEVRCILQRLYENSIVRFRKERGKDGWWLYFWSLDPLRLGELVDGRRQHTLSLLRQKLTFESENHFFQCRGRCVRLDFDAAFEHDFVCPRCGSNLAQVDNSFQLEELHSYIHSLESPRTTC
jgi:transcription initiation factor TFIIE subunit alpha